MNGLKRVSINGKPYPVFYGMLGFANLMKQHDLKFTDVQDRIGRLSNMEQMNGDDIIFLYDFIHAGFAMGCKIEEEEFPYNVEQLSAYISLQGDAVTTVFEAFAESMPQADANQKKAPARKKAKVK